jgi:hypothetical protein
MRAIYPNMMPINYFIKENFYQKKPFNFVIITSNDFYKKY